jgi:hypothetical protein
MCKLLTLPNDTLEADEKLTKLLDVMFPPMNTSFAIPTPPPTISVPVVGLVLLTVPPKVILPLVVNV